MYQISINMKLVVTRNIIQNIKFPIVFLLLLLLFYSILDQQQGRTTKQNKNKSNKKHTTKTNIQNNNMQRNQSVVTNDIETILIILRLLQFVWLPYNYVAKVERWTLIIHQSYHNIIGSFPLYSKKVAQSLDKKISLRTKHAFYKNELWNKCG